jgi:uncharacterized protein (DUF362 family)
MSPTKAAAVNASGAKVAIVSCPSYGPELREALTRSFDLLGGIGRLVKDKTVTVKVNLTGHYFVKVLGRTAGETYVTHGDTALALASVLLQSGAKRVRFVECATFTEPMEEVLERAGWGVKALTALGKVEVENTRNVGAHSGYCRLTVPTGGYLFSHFELNRSYQDTDVFVSLAKLKNHSVAGVTLAMKNLFGITPNALYGDQAGREDATAGRGRLHFGSRWAKVRFPGEKSGTFTADQGERIPRIIADLCAARPVDISVIDGVNSISGGEGPWVGPLQLTSPGLLITGLNMVSTDAVATAVMGYSDPRAARGAPPFTRGDNHLLLAEQAGLGTADLGRIDVRGLSIERARYPYQAS